MRLMIGIDCPCGQHLGRAELGIEDYDQPFVFEGDCPGCKRTVKQRLMIKYNWIKLGGGKNGKSKRL